MNCKNNHAFWAFVLKLYAAPGAPDALLTIQDAHGGDVMAVLWALAASSKGRRLSQSDIAAYTSATAAAAQNAMGCRAVRRGLKAGPEAVYEAAKASELAAERAVAASAPDPFFAGEASQDHHDDIASANMALILDTLARPVPPRLQKTLIAMRIAKKA